MRRHGVPLWFTWRTVLPETGVLCSLSDRFVALASKTWRCIDGKVNNGSNGGDANIIKRCHVGDSSAVFDVERIRPLWLQQPSLCSKEALLIKQSTDQFSSDAKTRFFHLQRESEAFSYICQTSHTCLLVSGEFQGSVVLPSGACFSRLEDDDVCRCMRLCAALTDSV